VLTCPQTDLLAPGMPAARRAIEALEAKEALGLCEVWDFLVLVVVVGWVDSKFVVSTREW
jgi:hypothetical protein